MRDTQCEICKKMYRGKDGLAVHKRVVHGINLATEKTDLLQKFGQLRDPHDPKKIIECPVCKAYFSSREGFVGHYTDVHGPIKVANKLRSDSISRLVVKAVTTPLESSKNLDEARNCLAGDLSVSSKSEWKKQRARLDKLFREANSPSPPRYKKPPDNRPKKTVLEIGLKPLVQLTGNPKVAWTPVRYAEDLLLDFDSDLGEKVNISQVKRLVDREVVLGIDFGTSCTKVVLGDPAKLDLRIFSSHVPVLARHRL